MIFRASASIAILALVSCGGSSTSPVASSADAGDANTFVVVDASTNTADAAVDAALLGDDASTPPPFDASNASTDGVPTRNAACTPLKQQTGTAINTSHGRLDGYLVYILPKDGASSCNGDDSHVHLQIQVSGDIYDVAVDIGTTSDEAFSYEADMAMPGDPWSEGWHGTAPLDYPTLGVHSSVFTAETPAAFNTKLVNELANVNHISIFGTGYSEMNGCHDVHYVGNEKDGAIVINPLSPTPHILFARFATPTF